MSRPLFELVTRIPHSLVGQILAEWLSIKDFCRLDTAFCRNGLRDQFLALLSSGQVVYTQIPSSIELLSSVPDLTRWVSQKGIMMTCTEIIPQVPLPLLEKYAQQTSQLMRTVSMQNFRSEASTMDTVLPVLVASCTSAVSLVCSYCDIPTTLKDYFLANKKLKHVRFRHCDEVQGEIFEDVALPKVDVASMLYSPVGDAVVMSLAMCCPNLLLLNLSDCGVLTDEAVLSIARTCTRLQLISLCGQRTITDAAVVELSRRCTALCIVDIGCCTALTDTSVIALASNCPKLDRLYLKGNANYTDAALSAVCAHNHALFDVLNVVACPQITASAVISVLHTCTRLTVLYIGTFTSDDVVSIIEKSGNLEKLALLGAVVEVQELRAIAEHCHHMIDLGMPNCTSLDNALHESALAAVVIECTTLETLVLPEQCAFASTFAKQLLQHWRPKLNVTTDVGLLSYDIEAQLDYYVRHNQM